MLDRLWLRLLLAASLALALAVGTVAVLTNRATSESFADYVEDVSAARAARAESVLSRHYQRNGTWAGAEPLIQLIADLSGQRVVLADATGTVVADSQQRLVGQRVQAGWAGDPVAITSKGAPVGSVYLDPLRPANRVDPRGQTFLATTNQYLLWAAAVGLLAALVVSLLLSRWLAAPLEALTHAARRMEQGELSQQIPVRIGGEIGELARAFNATAASLARLEQLREQMVADIAHELRTPLTNIRGYLEAIQDGVAEPNAETLGILEHELTQLTRLVDDLQELALAEAGRLTLTRQDLDPAELVARELLALRPQAEAAGVELAASYAPELPIISADGGRLGQALRNILRNALAHTPAGGRITVGVSAEGARSGRVGEWERARFSHSPTLAIRVRDTGSGIAPDHLPRIFERFYRGDRSRARRGLGGYGLGLTICRELIQAHGGQVSVESALGEGTEFTIRLPIAAPAPRPVEEPSPQPSEGPMVTPSRHWRMILATGIVVGGLFGGLAGLIETLLAVGARRVPSLTPLYGYAVLIDVAAVALLGGLAAGLALLVAWLTGRRFDQVRLVRIWAPAGCLLLGALTYWRWDQLYNRDDLLAAPQVLFAQVLILGAAAWLALLAGALLASRRSSAHHARFFARRLAPSVLAVLIGISVAGVARDLGHGFGFGAAEAGSDQESSPGNRGPQPAPGAAAPDPAPASAAPTVSAPAAPAAARSLNVLLITIDSLRADHLGSAGYPRARTPNLDALAAGGVRFSNAIANQPNGNSAQASLFTGTYPATNRVRQPMLDLLPRELPTLAELLAGRGYMTAGLYSWLSFEPSYSGLDRGFQAYTDLTVNRPSYLADSRASTLAATFKRLKSVLALPGAMDRQVPLSDDVAEQLDGKADVTTAAAIAWLNEYRDKARSGGQPFFLWVQYFDPHYPYTPPPPFDQIEPDDCTDCGDGGLETIRKLRGDNPEVGPAQLSRLIQYYDGEIAFTDRELGRLIDSLRRTGFDQNTLIVVAGENGESFGERGRWLNGGSLYAPEVRVPLLMRLPGRLPSGRTVDAVAQQVDVAPTILELLGVAAPSQMEGRSLLPLIRGEDAGDDRFAVAELGDRSLLSVVTRDWQIIKNVASGDVELYRTTDDPADLRDVADAEPERLAQLEWLLEAWREIHP